MFKAARRAKELRDAGELELLSGETLVESLGAGGYLTWESSPHVMWLARRLALGGR